MYQYTYTTASGSYTIHSPESDINAALNAQYDNFDEYPEIWKTAISSGSIVVTQRDYAQEKADAEAAQQLKTANMQACCNPDTAALTASWNANPIAFLEALTKATHGDNADLAALVSSSS